ncbi:hypothetical protein CR513_29019, partial [Mucuna pruriens]
MQHSKGYPGKSRKVHMPYWLCHIRCGGRRYSSNNSRLTFFGHRKSGNRCREWQTDLKTRLLRTLMRQSRAIIKKNFTLKPWETINHTKSPSKNDVKGQQMRHYKEEFVEAISTSVKVKNPQESFMK